MSDDAGGRVVMMSSTSNDLAEEQADVQAVIRRVASEKGRRGAGEEEMIVKRWMDWRCKPIQGTALGGWRGALCTIVSAGCGYFAFSGIYSNLVLYLIRKWQESNAGAANDLTNLLGTLFFTTVMGAFLGDAYWGRLWTVVVFQLMFAVGCVLVGVAATVAGGGGGGGWKKSFLFGALYVTALGCGSYEPAIASLGADQFNSAKEKATYFNWMFVACNVGQLPALTILTYIENQGGWALGFWISSALVLVSVPIFLLGAPYCRQYKPGGNPLLRLAQVLVAASRKLHVKPELDPKLLYEVPGDYSIIQGCLKIQHRCRFRWLDKAATMTEQDKENDEKDISPWTLCTVTQVEEVKGWVGMIPVLIFGAVAQAMLAQSATLFVEQGAAMDGTAGNSKFKIPPGSLQIVGIIVASVLAPVYDYFVLPLAKRLTKNPKGITSLQRMGAGLAATTATMVVAALVETKRLKKAEIGVNISIFWLVPQYTIVGVSMTLLIVGQMEFFYTEISESVRSLGICLTLVCRGLGNFISSLLVTIITSITSRGHRLGWIPHNLNLGHLDFFYWFLALLMLITLLLYILYAHLYTYIEQPNLIDTQSDKNYELPQK